MKFNCSRDTLLKALQTIAGAVAGSKPAMPILSHLVIRVTDQVRLLASDTAVEIEALLTPEPGFEPGEITVPARKLMDICRNLPAGASVHLALQDNQVSLKSGRSRFALATLPAADFPYFQPGSEQQQVSLSPLQLKQVIDRAAFCMATDDARLYLNGLNLVIDGSELRSVTSDGHRLATIKVPLAEQQPGIQTLIPRRCIIELAKLLDGSEDSLTLTLAENCIKVCGSQFSFTSNVLDVKFPDWRRLLPRDPNAELVFERDGMRQLLARLSALVHDEKVERRAVRLSLSTGLARLKVRNSQQEQAEEELEVEYSGPELDIGFRLDYLVEFCQQIKDEKLRFSLSGPDKAVRVEPATAETGIDACYVLMPMKL